MNTNTHRVSSGGSALAAILSLAALVVVVVVVAAALLLGAGYVAFVLLDLSGIPSTGNWMGRL
ncbi:hypothetical protein [Microbacterium caowuchunii]|uniref:Uncharacterized protein n=1 Tax=Microbacterium caowuchunii TaxID=2614638 RepID=A0A5N0TF48_9MICO|nr:hypothetical protein [Microbacterium caowuchunii]KAA9133773.1 hypothetical protein F6B40_08465 [Microbacterium caowuchunii]